MRTLRKLHRGGALLVGVFVAMHLANHLAALGGIGVHLRFMEAARVVYRQPLVEAVLLLAVAAQAASGLRLLAAGWRRDTRAVARLQALSGACLALFLLIHVAAVLAGRTVLDLDTNVHFAAAGLQARPYLLFFVPYYFLAVLALFTHLGCALARRAGPAPGRRAAVLALTICLGAVLSGIVVAALMGKLYPYAVPQEYANTYRAQAGPVESAPRVRQDPAQ